MKKVINSGLVVASVVVVLWLTSEKVKPVLIDSFVKGFNDEITRRQA